MSLLTLLITIAISAYLMLTASIGIKNFNDKFKLRHNIYKIEKGVDLARSSALLNKQSLILCLSNNRGNCQPGRHSSKYLLLVKQSNNELIKLMLFKRNAVISWQGFAGTYLIFGQNGQTLQNGHFNIWQNGQVSSKIYVNKLGKTYTEKLP